VYFLYWRLHGNARKLLLLAASYMFYAAWDWRFVGLLALTTAVDFVVGAGLGRERSPRARRVLLLVSIGTNLSVLGYFKYAGFFVESLAALLGSIGFHPSFPTLQIIVPVGISFYTFRSLTYTIDIYREQLHPVSSPLDYAVFLAFFPLLGAGPIVRARDLLPKLSTDRRFSPADLDSGATRFVLGLAKKVFVADTLGAHLVDPVFAQPGMFGAGILWLAVVGYAVQIYADFSGYSSMAIGVSRILGFRLRENFAYPYLATSIVDFWRRWHVSMTTWFREYLWWSLARKIPFRGPLATRLRWSGALIFVFLASGLWHGAAWTFVAWGGLHGVYLVANHYWRAWRESRRRETEQASLPGVLAAWLATQFAVCLAWVLFRCHDLSSSATLLQGLFIPQGNAPIVLPWLCWLAFGGFVIDHICGFVLEHRPDVRARVTPPVRGLVLAALIVFLWHGAPDHAGEFIYFRF
jgi:alginate O-acetyltransferase complex protein AlgI